MTPEEAMAEVAAIVYRQHLSDSRLHAALGGARCGVCARLGEAAGVLRDQATKEVQS